MPSIIVVEKTFIIAHNSADQILKLFSCGSQQLGVIPKKLTIYTQTETRMKMKSMKQ